MDHDKDELKKKADSLINALKPLSESYRLLVDSAEEFNGITLAHKKDLKDAIRRADHLGKIIDRIIDTLDDTVKDWIYQLKYDKDPIITINPEDE